MTHNININSPYFEEHREFIFFVSDDIIVYKDDNKFVVASYEHDIIAHTYVPIDYMQFEVIELHNSIAFIFGGKDIIIFHQSNNTISRHKLDDAKIGRCITKIFKNENNQIIFGTKCSDRVQFLCYDIEKEHRVCQTKSWKLSQISCCHYNDHLLTAVLDDSILTCCDMRTGQVVKTRFETGKINKYPFVYKDAIYYPYQEMIKVIDQQGNAKTARIPLTRISSFEHLQSNKLYFTSNNSHNLCCYDITRDKIIWEINGSMAIQESIFVTADNNYKETECLIERLNDHIIFINLNSGKMESSIKCPGSFRIRRISNNYILVHKTNGTTTIISGNESE